MENQIVVPVGPAVLGNTRPKRNRIPASKKWCFTLHNYSEADITLLNSVVPDGPGKFIIFSEERGASGGSPHLQGYIEFKRECRPTEKFDNKTFHWEKAKGSREQNVAYIEKEQGNIYTNGKLKQYFPPIGSPEHIAMEVADAIKWIEERYEMEKEYRLIGM